MANKEMAQRVSAVLDNIKGYLQEDGGDIELLEVTDDNIVKVRLVGACGTCPFSMMTLKNGVEAAIKRDIPEIVEVVNVP